MADHPFPAGVHQVMWDGRDERGGPVSSGIYVYRLSAYGISEPEQNLAKVLNLRKVLRFEV